MADIAQKIDDIGKPAWIGVTLVAFILFWPAGLAILAYLIWSGRMGNWKHFGLSGFGNGDIGKARGRWYGACGGGSASSGNAAFDEYREETLRRLEEEQKDFRDFLDRLRQAKDKAEFDQFMSDRRAKGSEGPAARPQG